MPEYEICTFNRFILKCAGECSRAHLYRVECAVLLCFCNNYHLSCCQLNDSIVLYISCFGSTRSMLNKIVENFLFKYIPCFGSTHNNKLYYFSPKKFKYIPCFGSTTVKSTHQIHNNLCIPCNSTIPNFFPIENNHLILFASPCPVSLFYNTLARMSLKNG